MAKLPEYQSSRPMTRNPQTSVTSAEIERPYRAIAGALENVAGAFQQKDLYEAANDGANNGVYRDDAGVLHVDRRSNLSETGRRYNAAAEQRFDVLAQTEVRTNLMQLADEAGGDVDKFKAGVKGFRDKFVGSIPQHLRGSVDMMFESEAPRVALGVSEAKRKRDLAITESSTKDHIALLMDDAAALARDGGVNTPAYKEAVTNIRKLYGGLVDNPDFAVSQDSVDIALKRMEGQNMSEAMLGEVDRALASGGITEARRLANSVLTDRDITLQPGERRRYSALMNAQIDGYVADRKAEIKPYQDAKTDIVKRLKQGVGLDDPDVDDTATALMRGGDIKGALEIHDAQRNARLSIDFKRSNNARQTSIAEDALGTANGSPELIEAIKHQESGHDPNAVSDKNAAGIMQVIPSTAREIAQELGDPNFPVKGSDADIVEYLKDATVNEAYGTHYLNKMLTRYGGDQEAALIAYNGGQARADRWLAAGRDDSVLPTETSNYYKSVLGRARATVTKPEDVTAARTFLQSRTDKDASHINGLNDTFAVKLSRLIQAAPPEIADKLGVFSGKRSTERQAQLFADAVKRYGSVNAARKWVAPPGKSQHEHGDAADLSFNGESLAKAPPEVVKWLHDNAEAYGLKFPLRNENWHIEDSSTRGGKQESAPRPKVDPDIIADFKQEVTGDLNDAFPGIQRTLQSGIPLETGSVSLLARQLAVVDDQDVKQKYTDLFAKAEAAGQLDGMVPAEREMMLSALKADAAQGATVAEADIVKWVEDSSKARDEAIKSDPLGYAVSRKFVAPMPAFDPAAPDTWASTFAASQSAVNIMQARENVGNISALRPEQAQQIAALWQEGDPNKLSALTNALSTSLTPETLRATLSTGPMKEALKGAVLSTDPAKYSSAMQQLDVLTANGQTTLLDLQRDFGEEAVNRLQDWQGMVRYYTADEMQDWLKKRNDPAYQDRIRPLISKGETEARKTDPADVVDALDTNTLLDANGPIDEQTQRMMMNDYVRLYGQRYGSLQDDDKAKSQAIERMHKVWGVTSTYGDNRGRVMPYPPEGFYPSIAGGHDWMAKQLQDIATARGISVENMSLVADGKTKAAIDRGQAPGYLISVINPDTGMEEMMTDAQGRVVRQFFDPDKARTDAAATAEEERRTRNDPWMVLGPDTAVGPYYGLSGADPADNEMTKRRAREIWNDQKKTEAQLDAQPYSESEMRRLGYPAGGQ